jgi:hypothetical protein
MSCKEEIFNAELAADLGDLEKVELNKRLYYEEGWKRGHDDRKETRRGKGSSTTGRDAK